MSHSLPGRIARSASLFIAGLLAATAMSATTVAAPATVSSTLTRATSCAGIDFHPTDSDTTYASSNQTLWRTTSGGSGWFLCDPGLPNKATVTRVRFTVRDDSGKQSVRGCSLVQGELTASEDAGASGMASVQETGLTSQTGIVRLSDTTIAHATIDRSKYAYWLKCQIAYDDFLQTASAPVAGIIGADVTYRISSTNG